MKHLSILLLVFALFSCDKKEVEPDLSGQVKGTYSVYSISDGVKTIAFPYQGITMGIKVVPIDKSNVKAFLTIGYPDGSSDTDEEDWTLKQNGISIEIYKNDNRLGYITGELMEINQVEDNGTRTIVKARK